jgi:two-component system OmpR family sensor kinase
VHLAELAKDVCRQARLLDPARTITCEVPAAEVVVADPGALKQVLLILLDNAVLHGEGIVRMTAHPDPSSSRIEICVHDQGPGIAPEARAKLFERFHRGNKSRHKPGLGLGLPIAKALVEAQDGTLSVESQVGKGSAFTVSLRAGGDGRSV